MGCVFEYACAHARGGSLEAKYTQTYKYTQADKRHIIHARAHSRTDSAMTPTSSRANETRLRRAGTPQAQRDAPTPHHKDAPAQTGQLAASRTNGPMRLIE